MEDTRKWILASFCLPKDGQKIYFFSDSRGIFLGQYFYREDAPSGCVSSHIFTSDIITLGEKDIQYWMPYDHGVRDKIPLPPNYHLVDTDTSQPMINSGTDTYLSDRFAEVYYGYELIDIPADKQQITLTY
jgi:hypothetical protein